MIAAEFRGPHQWDLITNCQDNRIHVSVRPAAEAFAAPWTVKPCWVMVGDRKQAIYVLPRREILAPAPGRGVHSRGGGCAPAPELSCLNGLRGSSPAEWSPVRLWRSWRCACRRWWPAARGERPSSLTLPQATPLQLLWLGG